MKMVIDTLNTTEWRNAYGLTMTETMDLEFSDYFFMLNALADHERKVAARTKGIEEELNSHTNKPNKGKPKR